MSFRKKSRKDYGAPVEAFNISYLVKIGILSALAVVLSFLEIPIAGFYKLDFSCVVTLIGSFSLGPLSGVIIALLKDIIRLPFTHTMCVGECADAVMTVLLVFPAAVIYSGKKNISRAVIGLVVGTLCMCVGGCLINYFFLFPFYETIYVINEKELVGMFSGISPYITDVKRVIILICAPFNLIKGTVCSLVTFILYKKVSGILHR